MPSSSNNNNGNSSSSSSFSSSSSSSHSNASTANSSSGHSTTHSNSAASTSSVAASAAAPVSAVHGRDLFLSRAINQSYHIIAKIGEGISGSVYKAIKRDTNEMVALKNFKNGSDSERASKEECHLLMQLKHIPHITPVLDVITSTNEYNIVFPYFEHDLSGLLSEHRFSIPQVKCYFKQLLQGILEIHRNGVMHRDIKAANILINNKGNLFIGDLGTATSYTKRSVFSNKVVTLWYRAPELLLGATSYGPEIDMWSIGCVLIELVTSRNFLPGNNEQQQIEAICKLCGTPTESNWNGVTSLPYYKVISNTPHFPSRLRSVFKNFSEDFLELLEGLLTLNPKKRLTAAQALQSPFFTNEPLPFEPEKMPGYQPIHVLEAIQKRVQQQAQQQPQPQSQQQVQQQPQQQVQQQPLKQVQQVQQPVAVNPTLKTTPIKALSSKPTKPSISNNLQNNNNTTTITTPTQTTPTQTQTPIIIKQTEQPKLTQQQEEQSTKISSATTTPTLCSQQNSPQENNNNNSNNGNNNLKRSYDLVNDLNNYCTATDSEEEECDCQVVELDSDIEVEVEVDEDYYDDSDYYTDDEDEDSCTDSECEFNYITSRAIQTFAAQQPQFEESGNPFLQPPKKQRTTSSFSSTFDVDVPIHLI